MARPVDPARAFVRGDSNVHDKYAATTGGRTFPHTGIDFTPYKGAGLPDIYAVYGGRVIVSSYDSGAGNWIVIAGTDGGFWLYGHLSSRAVGTGTIVSEGQKIGVMGSTGNSTGAHLHLSRYTSEVAARGRWGGTKMNNGKADWERRSNLSDPQPYIEASLKAQQNGFLMALTDAQQNDLYNRVGWLYDNVKVPNQPYGWPQANSNKLDALSNKVGALDTKITATQADVKNIGYPPGANYTWGAALNNAIAEVKAIMLALQPSSSAMTDEQVSDLAAALSETLAPATLNLLAEKITAKD